MMIQGLGSMWPAIVALNADGSVSLHALVPETSRQ